MTREEAIQELQNCKGLIQQDGQDWLDERDIPLLDMAIESLSAEAEPMTEEVREALMRLTMCAREECGMCKYKDECDFDFQYKISTDNMNTLADALMRSRCEVNAKSAEAGWIPCSEKLPKTGEQVLCCDNQSRVFTSALTEIASNGMTFFGQHCKVIAWMPLPKPYGESEVEE